MLRDKLLSRTLRQCPFFQLFCYREKTRPLIKLVPDDQLALRSHKLCTMPTFAKASAGKDGKNGQACHTCLATGRNSRLKYQDRHGGRRVTCHPYSLAPHYPDILCRDLTLGPLYCRAVRFHCNRKTDCLPFR